MKSRIFVFFCLLSLVACKKDTVAPLPPLEQHPEMIYKNFADIEVGFGRAASFDLNDDGQKDIYFSTQFVGDYINQVDKIQWLVISSFYSNLPVNDDEHIPVLKYKDDIPINNFLSYNWYNASSIILCQKILSNSHAPVWQGDWKGASNLYVPVQIFKDQKLYNGWVEISFSMETEKVIIHRAAVSKKENEAVKAGK